MSYNAPCFKYTNKQQSHINNMDQIGFKVRSFGHSPYSDYPIMCGYFGLCPFGSRLPAI